MVRRTGCAGLALLLSTVCAAAAEGREGAAIHAIYAHLPDAPENEIARRELEAAIGRQRLGPVEVVDVAGPPPPRAGAALRAGIGLCDKLKFVEALRELEAAAAEAALTGARGLTAAELGDLYLYRAMATQKADWKASPTGPDDTARARAWEDYVRAATLAPERVLDPGRFPPAAVESWRRATAEVQRRPRGTILVRAPVGAQISIDARPAVASPAAVPGLPYGEHHIRVEEPGRMPWAATAPLAAATLEVETPARAALSLDDATAAAHARRMGARFALVGELRLGGGEMLLEIRLVDVAAERRRDASLVSITGEKGAVDAAVMRLGEEARRLETLSARDTRSHGTGEAGEIAPSPSPLVTTLPRRSFRDDPVAWARDRWPLVTAVGVAVGTVIVLGLVVAFDTDPPRSTFGVHVDPRRLGGP